MCGAGTAGSALFDAPEQTRARQLTDPGWCSTPARPPTTALAGLVVATLPMPPPLLLELLLPELQRWMLSTPADTSLKTSGAELLLLEGKLATQAEGGAIQLNEVDVTPDVSPPLLK